MALDLPPKDAGSPDDKAAESKTKRAPSTAALAARVARLEKLVEHMADAQYGTNVRPVLPDDDSEENGE